MTVTCVIFDIDGTLSDPSHRIHWVRHKPKNWPAFNRSMCNDLPNTDIIWMLKTFHTAGCTILIATGRGEENRTVTETWLRDVAGVNGLYSKLYMRPVSDYRSDDIVKSDILDQMCTDGFMPTMVVDDRNQVVNMFRSRGLRVLQVNPGDF